MQFHYGFHNICLKCLLRNRGTRNVIQRRNSLKKFQLFKEPEVKPISNRNDAYIYLLTFPSSSCRIVFLQFFEYLIPPPYLIKYEAYYLENFRNCTFIFVLQHVDAISFNQTSQFISINNLKDMA